jgi:peptidoglycan/xylan/chitin deacetylase (PgdA/CDA1 family)
MPARAVWITFDDGYRSVVTNALPVLEHFGISATAFICPSAAITGEPLWFDRARAAVGVTSPSQSNHAADELLSELKQLADAERRRRVDALEADVHPRDLPASASDWEQWLAAGQTIGNHTWDHPCLDRCSAEEQLDQIERAEAWIAQLRPTGPRLFAFPNGFRSPAADEALRNLRFDAAVRFDHRIAKVHQPRHQLSRLRVADSAALPRFRAIVSGSHPTLFHLTGNRAPIR